MFIHPLISWIQSLFNNWFWKSFYIFRWQDFIEIALISAVFFYLSCWFKQDHNTRLLSTFYGYCSAIIITYLIHLPVITTALITFAPITLMCLIVLHKETLQKNFISLHALHHPEPTQEPWQELLVRTALASMSNDQNFSCIIEKKYDLQTILETNQYLHAPVTLTLLTLITKQNTLEPNKLIWLTETGELKAINTSWKKNSLETWLSQEAQELDSNKQNALFFTTKTDAIFLSLDAYSRTFTLIQAGKILEKLSAPAVLTILKHNYMYNFTHNTNHQISGKNHDNVSTHNKPSSNTQKINQTNF